VNRWIESVTEDCVLVTVAAVRGSAPREPGAKMLVTRSRIFETIGGGNLEHTAIERAREMLEAGSTQPTQLVRYPLGPGLRQCCGGVATLLFERIGANDASWVARLAESGVLITGAEGACRGRKLIVTETGREGGLGETVLDDQALALARGVVEPELRAIGSGNLVLIERLHPCDFQVVLFGAGHVGRALVAVLAGLDCRVTWVDPRPEQFPAEVPPNVQVVLSDAPEEEVDRAPAGAFFLVMTHSHALDFELCERVLKRGDFRYLGLIGSLPKRNRFLKYLKLEGVSDAALARLTCPIGVPGIAGKQPAAIAIAVAAELLQVRDARRMGNEARHSAS